MEVKKIVKNMMPDKMFLTWIFPKMVGYNLNLKSPKTFNEKLQWLKLYDRNPRYTMLVDKCAVKEIVANAIGTEYIIPTLGVWDNFTEIDFDHLPAQFVLKATHDSGSVFICRNKEKFNIERTGRELDSSLKKNFFYEGREWPYKKVRPRIIAEKYMVDESGYELKDYKLFVFSGRVKCIQVDYNRFTDHKRNFYDCEWNYMPFTTCYPTDPMHQIEKPRCLKEMIDCAETLSSVAGNPRFVRIDLYIINSKIYFGEYTFYHGGGNEHFYPEKWDLVLGEWINI